MALLSSNALCGTAFACVALRMALRWRCLALLHCVALRQHAWLSVWPCIGMLSSTYGTALACPLNARCPALDTLYCMSWRARARADPGHHETTSIHHCHVEVRTRRPKSCAPSCSQAPSQLMPPVGLCRASSCSWRGVHCIAGARSNSASLCCAVEKTESFQAVP